MHRLREVIRCLCFFSKTWVETAFKPLDRLHSIRRIDSQRQRKIRSGNSRPTSSPLWQASLRRKCETFSWMTEMMQTRSRGLQQKAPWRNMLLGRNLNIFIYRNPNNCSLSSLQYMTWGKYRKCCISTSLCYLGVPSGAVQRSVKYFDQPNIAFCFFKRFA